MNITKVIMIALFVLSAVAFGARFYFSYDIVKGLDELKENIVGKIDSSDGKRELSGQE